MIIDKETFTELCVHLKLASDALLNTAKHLAVISNNDDGRNQDEWTSTLSALTAMNIEITFMEKIMRALLEANREEPSPGAATQ